MLIELELNMAVFHGERALVLVMAEAFAGFSTVLSRRLLRDWLGLVWLISRYDKPWCTYM